MKLKEILVGLFGLHVLIILYYLPQIGKNMMNFFEHGSTNTFIFFLNSILQLGMTVLGVIGMFKFLENRNIFNPYFKAFFIYNLFSFLVYLPNNIAILFSDYVPESIGWSFYFFRIISLITALLTVVVFSKETIRVKVATGKQKRIRFYHLLIDNIVLTIFILQTSAGNLFYEFPIFSIFAPYLYFILYYWISETVFQQTIGKVATGKYVRREDGNRASTFKILGRTLSRFIPFEPFSFFGYPIKGWHDSISGTNVYTPIDKYQEFDDEILDDLVWKGDEDGEQL